MHSRFTTRSVAALHLHGRSCVLVERSMAVVVTRRRLQSSKQSGGRRTLHCKSRFKLISYFVCLKERTVFFWMPSLVSKIARDQCHVLLVPFFKNITGIRNKYRDQCHVLLVPFFKNITAYNLLLVKKNGFNYSSRAFVDKLPCCSVWWCHVARYACLTTTAQARVLWVASVGSVRVERDSRKIACWSKCRLLFCSVDTCAGPNCVRNNINCMRGTVTIGHQLNASYVCVCVRSSRISFVSAKFLSGFNLQDDPQIHKASTTRTMHRIMFFWRWSF